LAEVACSGLVAAVKLAALHRITNMRDAAHAAAAAAHRGSLLVGTAHNEVSNDFILAQNILCFIGPKQHVCIATNNSLRSDADALRKQVDSQMELMVDKMAKQYAQDRIA
jgi:hypothetical protein